MRDFAKNAIVFVIPPETGNCADDRTLLTRDVFLFLGIILLFASLAAVIIMEWRKEYGKEFKIESIKIPNYN